MKKLIIGLALLSSYAYASTPLTTFEATKDALVQGEHITFVMNFKKCIDSPYQTTASLTPHALQITDKLIATGDVAVTNLDPNNPGMLTRERVNYALVPFNTNGYNYHCGSTNGCAIITSSVYRMDNSALIKNYAPIVCPINSGMKIYQL